MIITYILLAVFVFFHLWIEYNNNPVEAKKQLPYVYNNYTSRILYSICWPYLIYRIVKEYKDAI